MLNLPLGERSLNVLKLIIQFYIATAEPVGSRTVSKRSIFNLSSATIRNIMADLEEMGLVSQPHTSAGRVPTDLGYRLYVDALGQLPSLTIEEKKQIENAYSEDAGSGDPYEITTRLLSSLCPHAGVVLLPGLSNAIIDHIQFIRCRSKNVLVVFITRDGLYHEKLVELEEDITQERLQTMSGYLNAEFGGLTLREMRHRILGRMTKDKEQYDSILRKAMEVGQKALENNDNDSELVLGGTTNIFNYPELATNLGKMRNIFKAFEEKSELIEILDKCFNEESTSVFIGSECQVKEMQDFSFVIHPYKSGHINLGALGVFGPKRMEYPRVMAIVDHMAEVMSRVLST